MCFLSFYLQVYLSMYDLSLPHSMSGLIFFCFFRKNINKKVGEGPYIKYVGGGQQGFCGVMKYIRHIFIDHEIFFKIFDGPRSIFWCSIFKFLMFYVLFLILFFKLRGLEHKLAIKDIYEKQDMLNKSHPLIHSANIR